MRTTIPVFLRRNTILTCEAVAEWTTPRRSTCSWRSDEAATVLILGECVPEGSAFPSF